MPSNLVLARLNLVLDEDVQPRPSFPLPIEGTRTKTSRSADHLDPRAHTRGNRPNPVSKQFASSLDAAFHAGSAAPIEPSVLRGSGY
jgi:hypothetical protein